MAKDSVALSLVDVLIYNTACESKEQLMGVPFSMLVDLYHDAVQDFAVARCSPAPHAALQILMGSFPYA